ncbi:hypothetical protein P775_12600 [Puniceibacterium antarcticum]|uniref:Uncharacterized protein n=1 Tax=Puniceibacterium antarcticum TaxID=1206336 RepID=A0A2G8REL3_9RHOB|nr:hypothetical protein P775_12600 [Puniceibacterium antarcticum]
MKARRDLAFVKKMSAGRKLRYQMGLALRIDPPHLSQMYGDLSAVHKRGQSSLRNERLTL